MQDKSVSLCASKTMVYSYLEMQKFDRAIVTCKTLSPVKEYKYEVTYD